MMFRGDLSKLGKFASNLRKLAEVPARVAKEGAREIEALIKSEFANSVDPYGNAWAPLLESTIKRKGGNDTILVRSGETAREVSVTPNAGAGIKIRISDFMGFHMTGTKWMTARRPLPVNTLPATWTAALRRVSENVFRETMGAA
jgi:hypothetical protein